MRNYLIPIALILTLSTTCTAFGAGGGTELPNRSSGSASRLGEPRQTPEEKARDSYNAGVRLVQKADELAAVAKQVDERKKPKSRAKAEQAYASAMKKFVTATELAPADPQAWNYAGYTYRKLGNLEAALAAYDRALAIQPNFAEAIEYRGQACLALNRLAEAKEAYLALFAGNRKLAASLLVAMQDWISERRAGPAEIDGAALESFASWVSERNTIASQTAALTREGAATAWQ